MAQQVRLEEDAEVYVVQEIDRLRREQSITASAATMANALIRDGMTYRQQQRTEQSRRKVKP